MESVQNVLEIHYHAPRDSQSPPPTLSKQQLLLFHAEAKGLVERLMRRSTLRRSTVLIAVDKLYRPSTGHVVDRAKSSSSI